MFSSGATRTVAYLHTRPPPPPPPPPQTASSSALLSATGQACVCRLAEIRSLTGWSQAPGRQERVRLIDCVSTLVPMTPRIFLNNCCDAHRAALRCAYYARGAPHCPSTDIFTRLHTRTARLPFSHTHGAALWCMTCVLNVGSMRGEHAHHARRTRLCVAI